MALKRLYRAWLDRCSRITLSTSFIPEVDGMRFAAIAAVVFSHLAGFLTSQPGWAWAEQAKGDAWNLLFHKGGYGVQLFFVISGFVLALPFAQSRLAGRRPPSLRRYYLRRLTRLEPPYLLCLGALFLLFVAVNHRPASLLLPHLLSGSLYLHNALFTDYNPILPVAWSLEVEVQFYLLAPLIALGFAIRRPALRRGLWLGLYAAAIAAQRLLGLDDPRQTANLLAYLQYFMMGFLLVDLYCGEPPDPARTSRLWDALGAAAWLALPWLLDSTWFLRYGLGLWLALLFWSSFRGGALRWIFTRPWITTIGGMCYTLYLFHETVFSLVKRIVPPLTVPWAGFMPGFAANAVLYGFAVLACGSAVFILIERPCMRRDWPQRLWQAARSAFTRPAR